MFGFQETGNKIKNEGQCFLCENKYSNRTILKHVKECNAEHHVYDENDKKANDKKIEDIFLIKITSEDKLFWLYLAVRGSTKLSDLDSFLRDKWLECCGHLSLFMINGKRYSGVSCKSVLNVGDTFTHEYDFGSTTVLYGQVLEKGTGLIDCKVKLIARNIMPDFVCLPCKSPATYICPFCIEFSCNKCSKNTIAKKVGTLKYYYLWQILHVWVLVAIWVRNCK